jgi:hypothetical protein
MCKRAGRSPRKGSVHCEEDEWNGWNDPLFTAALDKVGDVRAVHRRWTKKSVKK